MREDHGMPVIWRWKDINAVAAILERALQIDQNRFDPGGVEA
jgi:hypothetical protein